MVDSKNAQDKPVNQCEVDNSYSAICIIGRDNIIAPGNWHDFDITLDGKILDLSRPPHLHGSVYIFDP